MLMRLDRRKTAGYNGSFINHGRVQVMKQIISAVALFVVGLFSPEAIAQDVIAYPCDGCSSVTYKSKALQRGAGTHYFYNTSGKAVVAYEVFAPDEANPSILRAAYREPASWIVEEYAALLHYYESNGNSWTGTDIVSITQQSTSASQSFESNYSSAAAAGETVDAYDVVRYSSYRNQVATHLANDPRMVFTSVMASFGRAIRLAGVVTPDVSLNVHVSFPDGSKAIYRFNWNTKVWEYVKGSAVDSSGNNIPENLSQVIGGGGGYTFTNNGDLQDWYTLITSYGVQVGGGLGSPMVCAGSATTGVTCRLDHD